MAVEDSGGSGARSAQIVVGGVLAFFSLNVLNSSYSTVLELIKGELALTYTMSGALMSSYFVGYTIGQIPWGFLADRYGSRRVMAASILGIASSTLLFSAASGFWQAIAARLFSGLLGAGVFVPGVRLVSDWFASDRRGTALGLLSVGGSMGLIVSSWMVPLASITLGWRGTLAAAGAMGVVASALIFMTLRDRNSPGGQGRVENDISDVLGTRGFWVVAFVQFIRLGSNYAFIAWLPLLLMEEFGLSLVAAGAVYSLFNLAGMISNPVGGIVSDRVGERVTLMAAFAVLGAFTYIFIGLGPGALMYASVIAMGWCINFIRSPSFAIIPKMYGIERAGRISGVQNTFASAGALCIPLVLGYVRDTTSSYWGGWTLLSVLLLSASAVTLTLKTTSEATPQ
jgi:NNP family nitrate/nitrite transporter-like MFS transporter